MSKRGYYPPLQDRMYCTYTDIRETLEAIRRAHEKVRVQKERRIARQSATRVKAVKS